MRQLADDEVSAGQLGALDLCAIPARARPAEVPDAVALADREEDLASWLTRHGVGREWEIAPALAAAGADLGWCDRAAGVLARPALEPGLEWVASALSVGPLLAEMKGIEQAHLDADRRGQVLLADGPGVDAAHRRHRGPGRRPGHARP